MADYRTIADLTDDLVIYRDLKPYDSRLPNLDDLREPLGLPRDSLPRKRDADYARVLGAMLQHFRTQHSEPPLRVLLIIGDSSNDTLMAQHLRETSDMRVFACIGTDQLDQPATLTWEGDTATATRWSLLQEWFDQVLQRYDPASGELPWSDTALLLDIDKTLLGPRGRNHQEIDEARAEAALRIAQAVFGHDLDAPAFRTLYNTVSRPEFLPLTLDNQDYIVYISMLLACGVLMADDFLAGMSDESLATFTRLLEAVEPQIPRPLYPLHKEVRNAHQSGDPTPFKAFRRAEFAATLERIDDGRLLLSCDVVAVAEQLTGRGVLCVAASDKPAESALPTKAQQEAGLRPLHRASAKLTDLAP